MQNHPLYRNLKVFFDPGEGIAADQWFFADAKKITMSELQQLLIDKKLCVLHFNRHNFWRSVVLRVLLRSRQNIITRTVLFKNDGLLSSFFEAKDSAVYTAFRKAHLPELRGLKSRLINYLPLAIRADGYFLLVSLREVFDDALIAEISPELKQLNFMFFSNVDGKILLVDGKTFHNGFGLVAKTTTNPEYCKVMAKEFDTLQSIFELTDQCGITPEPIKHLYGKGHDYFLENYIGGRSLREILRDPQTCTNQFSVCSLINRLDDWFNIYSKGFKGNPKPFQELYLPLFTSLRSVFFDNPEISLFVEKTWQALILLDQKHPGLTPVIAHNDLWPGNFVVTSNHLVAVDWERATSDRSELFDYFWLIISAVLEYRVGVTGVQDYGVGFRSFMFDDDLVCGHARDKILSRLVRNDIPQDLLNLFYSLFLMEWSVQGFQALGRQTDMDRLAFGELLNYSKTLGLT